ncbi:MAG: ABC transporter permease [Spirochaetales bacterium]|nr:ABC transporter permease [Spirochaetales bacterium]
MIWRLLAILRKDFRHGPKSFFFVQAVVTPIITSIMITALFGSFLSGKPAVGFYYQDSSSVQKLVQDADLVRIFKFDDIGAMRSSVASGKLDMGIVIPSDFDRNLKQGITGTIQTYTWGQSLLKDRAAVMAGLFDVFVQLAGIETRVEIDTVILGNSEIVPLGRRFLPLMVLLATVMSGLIIPASALVDEKQKGTLLAMQVSPVSFGEVVAAKSSFGLVMSLIMGLLILLMNRSFGENPGALLLTLVMAAAFACTFGGLAGILAKDIAALMSLMKSSMLLLYAPGILNLFPKVPPWIGKIFPTYYMFYPVLEVSQHGARLSDVALELGILAALTAAMCGLIIAVGRKKFLLTA